MLILVEFVPLHSVVAYLQYIKSFPHLSHWTALRNWCQLSYVIYRSTELKGISHLIFKLHWCDNSDVFQGYGWPGALPNDHNSLLQRSYGGCLNVLWGTWNIKPLSEEAMALKLSYYCLHILSTSLHRASCLSTTSPTRSLLRISRTG